MTKTLKIGIASLADYKARTLAIARGDYKPSKDEPKVWFQSMESFAKVLSDRNRALLATITATHPRSVHELAERTGRAASNVSRTLRTMERYGLVEFEAGEGKARIPRVPYSEITLDVPLAGEPA
ncbi:MAG TPA: MarR family transcriptional regulator [Caulobacteraceae bacterium]|nr:MarR family transcriptional regulator [Caulobacteraceae bacterium]